MVIFGLLRNSQILNECFQQISSFFRYEHEFTSSLKQLFRMSLTKGGSLPLSRNFLLRTRVNKIEAMYKRSPVNINAERRSTFTLVFL